MTSLRRRLLPLLAAALLAALLSGCGGSATGADADPQELLERTFGGSDVEVRSGVLDVTLQVSGSGQRGSSLDGSLTGPFQSFGEEEPPHLDLDFSLEVQGGGKPRRIEAGATVTGERAFISYQGTDYEVDEATFAAFKDVYAQSVRAQGEEDEGGSPVLSQLGIDPAAWLAEVRNEGVEEIEGEETVHITGTPDLGRIVADARRVAEAGGGAAGLDADEVGGLEESVTAASVDVYTGVEDSVLRRLDLNLDLNEPGGGGALTLALSIELTGVNEEQEFSTPTDARPLEELVPGGLGALGASPDGP